MDIGINAELTQGVEIQFLNIIGGRLQNHLKLVVVLQAVGIFTVAAVCRTAAGLHIGAVPAFGANGAQESCRVEGSRTYLHVQRLKDDAVVLCPKLLQRQNKPLECRNIRCSL